MNKIIKILFSGMLTLSLFNFTPTIESAEAATNSPKATISDGGVSISISGSDGDNWDGQYNMKENVVYDVEVTATYNDATSSDKTLSFYLPEGLKFVQIPVVEGKYNTTGIDTGILGQIPTDDPRYSAVQSMTIPEKDSLGASFGKVEYTFDATPATVSMNFKVRLDSRRVWTAHIIPEKMSASVSKNGESIGDVSGEIKADTPVRPYFTTWRNSAYTYTQETQINNSEESFEAITPRDTLNIQNYGVKKITMYIYYPKGANYIRTNGVSEKYTTVHEPDKSRVVVSYEYSLATYEALTPSVTYDFPEGSEAGTYTVEASTHGEVEMYNGDIIPVNSVYSLYSVEVYDELLPTLKVSKISQHVSVDSSIDMYEQVPAFSVKNETAITAKNVVAHFEFDEGLIIKRITTPNNYNLNKKITKMEYKVYGSDEWISASANEYQSIRYSLAYASIMVSDLNLSDGEKLSEMRFWIGNVGPGFGTPDSPAATGTPVGVVSKLEPGYSTASVRLTTYTEGYFERTEATDLSTVKDAVNSTKTIPSGTAFNYVDESGVSTRSVIAGDNFTITGNTKPHTYTYHNLHTFRDPIIYLHELDGMKIKMNTFVLQDQNGTNVDYKVTEFTSTEGNKVYAVTPTEQFLNGYFIGEDLKTQYLNFNVDVQTDIKGGGNINSRDIYALGSADPKVYGGSGYNVAAYRDIYDYNENGKTTEMFISHSNQVLAIQKNDNVLVETFLSLDGQEPTSGYIEGDEKTVSHFTPGTEADYTVKVTNNGGAEVEHFSSYIPIPKTGENFGQFFQTEAFNWNATLTQEVPAVDGFVVKYGVGETAETFSEKTSYMTYEELIAAGYTLSEVNMVLITATQNVAKGAEAEFVISFKVDESFDSANDGNKIGTRNVYNPAYDVASPTFAGRLTGTKVAEELVIAEIGGMAFKDVDADGLYNSANGDTVVAGHEVELYKLNEATGAYEPVLDKNGVQYKVMTNTHGVYLFDHNTGMNYGTYAVRFVEVLDSSVYQYTINVNTVGSSNINSDAIIANDIPNPGDNYRGWVLGIDPITPEAKTIGVGFLKYDPPADFNLKLSVDDQVLRVGETKSGKPNSIEPGFWEEIKATEGAYTWSLVNESDSQYVSLANTDSEYISVTGLTPTPEGYYVELKLTIKDIYNNTTSDVVNIKVIPEIEIVVEGEDFFLDSSEVASLTEEKVIELGKGSASDITTGDVVAITADYSNIKPEAGSYDVIFQTATGESKTVKATVGNNLVDDNGIALSADNVVMWDYEVAAFNEDRDAFNDDLVIRSNARAWTIEDNNTLLPVTADSAAFDMADLTPYSYNVVYNHENTNVKDGVLTTDARLTIKGKNTVIGDKDAIDANDFALIASEVDGLTDEKVIELANARAWLLSDGSEVEITEVDFSLIEAKQGVYDVTFTNSYGTKTTVQAFVGNHNRPTIKDGVVVFAEDYTKKVSDIPTMTLTDHIEAANASAIDQDTYEELEITHIDVSNVLEAEGQYPAEFGVDKTDLKTKSAETQIVKADSVVTVIDDSEAAKIAKTGMTYFGSIIAMLILGLIVIARMGYRKIRR